MSKRFVLVALLGVLGFFLVGVMTGFGYLFMMGTILGSRGVENAMALIAFPILSLFAAVIWLALHWFLTRRSRTLSGGRTLLYGALLGLAIGFSMSGSEGFMRAGGATYFNYFTMALGAGGASLHWLLARRAA